eukprot:10097972-Alexandrium_andersonii.AAC.1
MCPHGRPAGPPGERAASRVIARSVSPRQARGALESSRDWSSLAPKKASTSASGTCSATARPSWSRL